MSKKESTTSPNQALIDSLRNVAGIAGLVGGFSYVTGYLIVNFYLSQYGIVNLSLVQSRYFASGALFLVVSMLISGTPLIVLLVINQATAKTPKQTISSGKVAGLIVISLVLTLLLLWTNIDILTGVDNEISFARTDAQRRAGLWLALPSSQIALFFPFIVYYLTRWSTGKFNPSLSGQQPLLATAFFGGLFVTCVIISLFVFGRYVYSNSSPSLGGGAQIIVQIIVTDNISSHSNLPLKIEDGITEPVILIDQSENSLLLFLQGSNQTMELSTKEVIGVIHK